MKTIKTTLTVILIIFVSLKAQPQEKDNLLRIQGDAFVSATPEIMVVNIPIQHKDSVYERCMEVLALKFNLLKKSLNQKYIPEKSIKSDDLNIQENFKWNQREQVPDGYIGRVNVVIEQKYTPDNLNIIINTLNNEKFNFGYNVTFSLSEEQKDSLREKVIKLALEDASIKADIITKKMNIKLSEISEVNFGGTRYNNDYLTMEEEESEVFYIVEDGERVERITLNPKMLQIQKSIVVVWKIEQ